MMCNDQFQIHSLIRARILAGVEKMFNGLQDYAIIDRRKRKPWPRTPRMYKDAVSHTSVSSFTTSNT